MARETEKYLLRKRNVSENSETFFQIEIKFASATKRARKQRNIAWKENFRNNVRRVRGRLAGKFLSATFICVMLKKLSWAAMMEARATLCNSSQVRSLVLFRGIVTSATKWTRHLTSLSAAMKFLTFIQISDCRNFQLACAFYSELWRSLLIFDGCPAQLRCIDNHCWMERHL